MKPTNQPQETVTINPGQELDLHHFNPRDAKAVVQEFIEMNVEAGIREVRIIHGKGRSVIKSIVHGELETNRRVVSFKDQPGNWGATIVSISRDGRAGECS